MEDARLAGASRIIGVDLNPAHLRALYGVHDEVKDKAFELELSWICDESNRQHQKVPNDLLEQDKGAAQAALKRWMLTKKSPVEENLFYMGTGEIFDLFW